MLGFEQTSTGYRATDEQVAWWESRDTCPDCGAIAEPYARDTTPGGRLWYVCPVDRDIKWSRES